jgi:hypothetical protein
MSSSRHRLPAEFSGQVVVLAIAAGAGLWLTMTARPHHSWSLEWRLSVGVGLLTIAVAFGLAEIGRSLVTGRWYAWLVSLVALIAGVIILVGSAAGTTAPGWLRWTLTEWEQGLATELGAGLVILAVFDVAVARWLEAAKRVDEAHVEHMKAVIKGTLSLDGLTLAETELVTARLGDLRRLDRNDKALIAQAATAVQTGRPDELRAVALDRMIALESRAQTITSRALAARDLVAAAYHLDEHHQRRLFLVANNLQRESTLMPWDVEVQLADYARLWSSGTLQV